MLIPDVEQFQVLLKEAFDRDRPLMEAKRDLITVRACGGFSCRHPQYTIEQATIEPHKIHAAARVLGPAIAAFEAGVADVRARHNLREIEPKSSDAVSDLVAYIEKAITAAVQGGDPPPPPADPSQRRGRLD